MPAFAPIRQRLPTEIRSRAAAGQRAHDRRAAADVGAVADDDAGRDPALDHRRAERAGVVVDEALVHDGGARRPGGRRGAPGRRRRSGRRSADVVDHPRELVDAEDLHRPVGAAAQAGALEVVDRARAGTGPHHVRQHAEDAVEVETVRRRPGGARAGAGAGRRPGRRGRERRGRSRTSTTSLVHAARRRACRARRPARSASWSGCCAGRVSRRARARGTRCRAPARPPATVASAVAPSACAQSTPDNA